MYLHINLGIFMKVCFLVSGNGGNLKFLFLAKELSIVDNIEISVIGDRNCNAISFARENNIYSKKIKYKQDYNKELLHELEYIAPDIIVTTWNKIIDEEIVTIYAGKLINLHYSLLPAFAGLMGITPIEQAYKLNCQYLGVTCHYVDEDVDSGQIISQAVSRTEKDINILIENIFKNGCLILLNSLMIVVGERIIKFKENKDNNYSPALMFDNMFTDRFWKILSSK